MRCSPQATMGWKAIQRPSRALPNRWSTVLAVARSIVASALAAASMANTLLLHGVSRASRPVGSGSATPWMRDTLDLGGLTLATRNEGTGIELIVSPETDRSRPRGAEHPPDCCGSRSRRHLNLPCKRGNGGTGGGLERFVSSERSKLEFRSDFERGHGVPGAISARLERSSGSGVVCVSPLRVGRGAAAA